VNREHEPIAGLGAAWSKQFASALEAMADERPEMEVREISESPDGDVVWWKQSLDAAPGSAVWIGAPRPASAALGQRILGAAGIDSSDAEEQKNAYLEVVRQSLGSFAGVLGAQIGREVACKEGAEEAPPADSTVGCEIRIRRADMSPPLYFLINRELLEAASQAATVDVSEGLVAAAPSATEEQPPAELSTRAYSTLNLLMDVELPVSVSFGRTRVRRKCSSSSPARSSSSTGPSRNRSR